MAFLIKRGKRARTGASRCHLAKYDAHGRIVSAWCGRTDFNLTCNVGLGLKRCKVCVRAWEAAA